MTTINRKFSALMLLIVTAGISLFTIGCADNPMGAGNGATPMDQITVTLTRIGVTYDCDNNVSLVDDAAGDFFYSFYVQTKNAEGKWETVQSFPEKEIKINNNETGEIPARSVSFSLPRENGQAFRVYTGVREQDFGGKNDFSSSHTFTHVYAEGQSQPWSPSGSSYTSFNTTTNNGYMRRNISVRDQKFFLGVVTEEGCKLNVRYDVDIRPAN